jgi:L-amino acid N-acyltransferase YncA
VLVAPALREQGLGRLLIQESFILGISMDLSKLTARMTLDQDAAMEVFQDMGFKPEAMLKEHVEDREGERHDLVILSHDVAQFEAQLQAYGVSEAFDD